MADQIPTDPGEAFRKMVTDWERNFDSFANKVMGTEGFSRAMNTAQNSQLEFQQAFAEGMGRQLKAMNMPTREDVLRLTEAVSAIDRRLARIEDNLGLGVPEPKVVANVKVKRTRKPPEEYLKAVSASGDK